MTCARCDSVLEEGDLRCAICALPAPVVEKPADDARPIARVLRCGECGAAVAFSPLHGAPVCAFCGALMRVETPIDPIESAALRVPFTVDREAAIVALRGWLGTRGFFAPAALRNEAVVEAVKPLWWAAWIVDAVAGVAWTADSDAGARRADWAPHAGEVAMKFDRMCIPASRGLSDAECGALAPFYDLATAVPASTPLEPVDGVVEAFEAQRSAARHLVQRAIEDLARVRVTPFIPGKQRRKVRVACLLERQTTRRVALPVWVLAYRYRGRPYRALVHGGRARLVRGRAPLDRAKLAWIVGALLALAIVIRFIVR